MEEQKKNYWVLADSKISPVEYNPEMKKDDINFGVNIPFLKNILLARSKANAQNFRIWPRKTNYRTNLVAYF